MNIEVISIENTQFFMYSAGWVKAIVRMPTILTALGEKSVMRALQDEVDAFYAHFWDSQEENWQSCLDDQTVAQYVEAFFLPAEFLTLYSPPDRTLSPEESLDQLVQCDGCRHIFTMEQTSGSSLCGVCGPEIEC